MDEVARLLNDMGAAGIISDDAELADQHGLSTSWTTFLKRFDET
jgi:hypothetical protein